MVCTHSKAIDRTNTVCLDRLSTADIARRKAGEAGALEESKENQLAYIDAAFSDKDRERHDKARQIAYVQSVPPVPTSAAASADESPNVLDS